jgi:voltage-dependent calcium channel R type alpha-1E
MNIMSDVFNYVFTFEMAVKIVSLGFVMDDGSYLRESWNILDFGIVSSSLLEMSL